MWTKIVARFGVLGGAGYALGGAVGVLLISLPFSVLVGGAIGGAALGLALGSWKKTIVLTLLSALGLTVGVLSALAIGSFFNYSIGLIGAIVGALVGASVGVAFLDWRRVAVLAVSGSAGFAAGLLTGGLLRYSFPVVRGVGSIVIAGLIGGALLGATLGYLEVLKVRRG